MKKIVLLSVFVLIALTSNAQLVQKTGLVYTETGTNVSYDSVYILVSNFVTSGIHFGTPQVRVNVNLYFSKYSYENGFAEFTRKSYTMEGNDVGVGWTAGFNKARIYNFLVNDTGLGINFDKE